MSRSRRPDGLARSIAVVGPAAAAPACWVVASTGAASGISAGQATTALLLGVVVAVAAAAWCVRTASRQVTVVVRAAAVVAGVALIASTGLDGMPAVGLVALSGIALPAVASASADSDRSVAGAARIAIGAGLGWGLISVTAVSGDAALSRLMLWVCAAALVATAATALALGGGDERDDPANRRDLLTATTRPATIHVSMVGFAAAGATLLAVVMTASSALPGRAGSDAALACALGLFVGVAAAQTLAVRGRAVGTVSGLERALTEPRRAILLAAAGLVVSAWTVPVLAGVGAAVATAGALTALLSLDAVCRRPIPLGADGLLAQISTAVGAAGALGGAALLQVLDARYGASVALLGIAAVVAGAGVLAGRATDHVDADVEAEEHRTAQLAELEQRHHGGGTPPRLECAGLAYSYGNLQVLFDVSLRIGEGEIVALLGPNGVGKTTTLDVLSGLGRPDRGLIRLDGRDVVGLPTRDRVGLGLSHVVGQASFGSLSVVENLRMHAFASRASLQRVDDTLAVFPRLYERRNQQASTLSGGERQMLALSKSLVQQPRVLLVDELSLGLAPVVVGGLITLVRRLREAGVSILVVEQSANVALDLADRAYFMEKGRIVEEGSASRLAADPDLVAALMLGGDRPEPSSADLPESMSRGVS